MKITLIVSASPNDTLIKSDPFMPLSLPLLAGAASDHEYTFIDMLAGEIIDFAKPADLVGISMRITAEKTAFDIADKFRNKKIKVVLGGAQASVVPFKAKKHADAVVVGEGELLWPVLLDDLKQNRLKDFYVCSPKPFEAEGFSLHQVNLFPDLNKAPFPIRKYFRKKYSFDTVFASRGCPVNCDFCSVTNTFGSHIRTRPVEDVVKEINTFRNFYYLLDDTVFGRPSNHKYYLELYDAIIRLKKRRFWIGQANLDAASTPEGRAVIKKAAESGLVHASIGIESINPEVMKKTGTLVKNGVKTYDKTTEEIKKNIAFIREQGIVISGWFIIGNDEDTYDTFFKTLEFCNKTKIIPILNILEALPGTRLYEKLEKENRIDNQKLFNIIHPFMKDDEIISVLQKINKKIFSLSAIIKLTYSYTRHFGRNCTSVNEKIFHKIFKTIFTFVLMTKLKKGVATFVNQ
jgi:radical SAM superfamily enzyme YgiQ (UPF0313 family)